MLSVSLNLIPSPYSKAGKAYAGRKESSPLIMAFLLFASSEPLFLTTFFSISVKGASSIFSVTGRLPFSSPAFTTTLTVFADSPLVSASTLSVQKGPICSVLTAGRGLPFSLSAAPCGTTGNPPSLLLSPLSFPSSLSVPTSPFSSVACSGSVLASPLPFSASSLSSVLGPSSGLTPSSALSSGSSSSLPMTGSTSFFEVGLSTGKGTSLAFSGCL